MENITDEELKEAIALLERGGQPAVNKYLVKLVVQVFRSQVIIDGLLDKINRLETRIDWLEHQDSRR